MNKFHSATILTIIGLLLFSLTSPVQAEGNPPWIEDFETSVSLDHWYFSNGSAIVEDGFVKGKECAKILSICEVSMWRDVNESTGVWELVYYHNESVLDNGLIFYFVGNGVVQGEDADNGLHPRFAYGIYIRPSGSIQLFYQPDANTLYPVWFNSSENTGVTNGWFNYTITRNELGEMKVYRNSTLRLEATDTNLNSSEYINIQFEMNTPIDYVRYHDPEYVITDPPVDPPGPGPTKTSDTPILTIFQVGPLFVLIPTLRRTRDRNGIDSKLSTIHYKRS